MKVTQISKIVKFRDIKYKIKIYNDKVNNNLNGISYLLSLIQDPF